MSKNKGTSLAEALIISVIVGVIAAGTFAIFFVSKKTTHKTGDKIVALNDARLAIFEQVVKKGHNFVDIGTKAIKDYEDLSKKSGEINSVLTQTENWNLDPSVNCETGRPGDPGANINYCYKDIKFTVDWENR